MKKAFICLFCASALLAGVSELKAAEEEMLPPPPPHEQTDHRPELRGPEKLADELKLTDEQREQAEKVRREGFEKAKPLMKQMKEIRQKLDEERKANMAEFEKILTPEQKVQFDKIKENMKHRRGPGHKWKKGVRHDRKIMKDIND